MVFEIRNIGKISQAALEMQGITVIAGHNNTGKSTFGKILYCMFSAFCNAPAAVQKERERALRGICAPYFRLFPPSVSMSTFIQTIMAHGDSREDLRGLLQEALRHQTIMIDREDDQIESVIQKIGEANEVSDEALQKGLLTGFLKTEFDNSLVYMNRGEETGTISLRIEGKLLQAEVNAKGCLQYTDEVHLTASPLYLDNPFILDEIARFMPVRFFEYNTPHPYNHREQLLHRLCKPAGPLTVIHQGMVKQKLQRLLSVIQEIIPGEFTKDQDDWRFQEAGLDKPLRLCTTAAGMKPFLIIKRLLEAGEIKEQSLLICDDPETGLHPEWQSKYADLLVLLQKEFNLTLFITTHSPDFFRFLEAASQKYDLTSRCTYYTTENRNSRCTITQKV